MNINMTIFCDYEKLLCILAVPFDIVVKDATFVVQCVIMGYKAHTII